MGKRAGSRVCPGPSTAGARNGAAGHLHAPRELSWVYRDGASRLLPDRWEEFTRAIPDEERDDLVAAYRKRLESPHRDVRVRAALAWTRWEIAGMLLHPDPDLEAKFAEPDFAVAFARIESPPARHNWTIQTQTH